MSGQNLLYFARGLEFATPRTWGEQFTTVPPADVINKYMLVYEIVIMVYPCIQYLRIKVQYHFDVHLKMMVMKFDVLVGYINGLKIIPK